MYEFHTTRRIEFSDTDMAGIVHFSRYFVFMESAEHEFLRSLGAPIHCEYEGIVLGWPRVAASCQYLAPARLGDVLDVRLLVRRKGRSSLTYDFEFRCGDAKLVEGRVTVTCCAFGAGRGKPAPLRPMAIPASLAEQIGEAPPEEVPDCDRRETRQGVPAGARS